MEKQVIISLDDFKRIESIPQRLDRIFYELEHLSECVEDENNTLKFDFMFDNLKECIDILNSAIE